MCVHAAHVSIGDGFTDAPVLAGSLALCVVVVSCDRRCAVRSSIIEGRASAEIAAGGAAPELRLRSAVSRPITAVPRVGAANGSLPPRRPAGETGGEAAASRQQTPAAGATPRNERRVRTRALATKRIYQETACTGRNWWQLRQQQQQQQCRLQTPLEAAILRQKVINQR